MPKVPDMAECKPGIAAFCEYNVLIAPEEVETKTAGGIILPDAIGEQKQLAAQRGRLVMVGYQAGAEIWPKAGAARPEVGDMIFYAKYAGTMITGADGREYRAVKDKDVIAIIEKGAEHG